jgi:hypothetical protein
MVVMEGKTHEKTSLPKNTSTQSNSTKIQLLKYYKKLYVR